MFSGLDGAAKHVRGELSDTAGDDDQGGDEEDLLEHEFSFVEVDGSHYRPCFIRECRARNMNIHKSSIRLDQYPKPHSCSFDAFPVYNRGKYS